MERSNKDDKDPRRNKQTTPDTLFEEESSAFSSAASLDDNEEKANKNDDSPGTAPANAVETTVEQLVQTNTNHDTTTSTPLRRTKPRRTKQVSSDMLPMSWYAVQNIEEAAAAALARKSSNRSVPEAPDLDPNHHQPPAAIPTQITFMSKHAKDILDEEANECGGAGDAAATISDLDRLTVDDEEFIDRSKRIIVRSRKKEEEASRKQTTKCNCFMLGFLVLLSLSLSVPLMIRGGSSSSGDNGPTEDDGAFDMDPFADRYTAIDPQEAYLWQGGQSNATNGLELTVVNALDDSWQSFFDAAVADWETGEPDALSLNVQRNDYEFECIPESRTLKVCNGNYGDTGWKGLNGVILNDKDRTIVSSAAKMNDYYLMMAQDETKENYQRQYIMCHELGHGFGLPHFDEEAGNCMADTTDPRGIERPNESNFEFLASMYGVVTDVDESARGEDLQQTGAAFMGGGDGRRHLNLRGGKTHTNNNFITRSVLDSYHATMKDLEHPSWRRLPEDDVHGQILERELGEGFVLQVHMLQA